MDPIKPEEPPAIILFVCGPDRTCDHQMDHYEPIYDSDGRTCGVTLVCAKCGMTAFDMAQWG